MTTKTVLSSGGAALRPWGALEGTDPAAPNARCLIVGAADARGMSAADARTDVLHALGGRAD